MKTLLTIWLWLGCAFNVSASHIIGGYISYRHLGQFQYEITLTVYRDCYNGIPGFDDPAFVGIYRSNGTLYQQLEIENPQITLLNAAHQDPCIIVPGTVCVQEGIYRDTVYLAPGPFHYDITYQRCCRNATILNIQQPANTGATYTTRVPRVSAAVPFNNSPVFKDIPPITICKGEALIADQSAYDADGDSLVYYLCEPLSGQFGTVVQPNPPAPPPYSPVAYQQGYSAQNPLPASPPLAIHPTSGAITGTPLLQGQFVVGVCVREYRKGQLINTYLRDFQFNVVQCPKMAAIAPVVDTVWCQPYTVQFSNQSINATGYAWDFGDPNTTNDTSSLPNPQYTYPSTGRYTVQLIAFNQWGCRDTAFTEVMIRKGAQAQFVHSAPCKNPDLIFTDVSTSQKGTIISRSWDFGDGSSDTGALVRHTYPAAGSYWVTLTIETTDGCVDSRTRQVQYKPAPIANFPQAAVCAYDSLIVQSTSLAPGSIITAEQWRLNGITQGGPVSKWLLPAGNYSTTLIVTNQIGCTDSITKTLTVLPPPVPAIIGDTAFCPGDSITLNGIGGTQYLWTFAHQQHTGQQVSWQPGQQQTVLLTVTDSNGCAATASQVVTPHPIKKIVAAPDTMACPGDTLWLTATGGIQYQWPTPVQMDSLFPYIITTTNTSIVVTGIDSFGCASKDTLTIRIRNRPTIQLSPTQTTICAGQSVGLLAQGAATYSWEPPHSLSCSQCPNPVAITTVSQVYTVTAKDQFGCVATDSVAITMKPSTTIRFPQDTSLCEGDTLPLSLSGVATVTWIPGTGMTCDTCLQTTVVATNTTLYKAALTDNNGCPKDSQWLLTVYPKPQISWMPTQPAYCTGDSIQIQLQGASTWQWSPTPWLSCLTCPNPIIKAPTDMLFEAMGTNGFGCSQTIQIPITVHPLPVADLGPDTIICSGDSLILTVPTGQQFNWRADHSILGCTNCHQTVVKPLAPARVYLTLSDQYGCKDSDTLDIDLFPTPNLLAGPDTVVCVGEPIVLRATAAYQYRWLPTGIGSQPDTSHYMIWPTQSFTATLQATDTFGCARESLVQVAVWPAPFVDAGADQVRYRQEPFSLEAAGAGTFLWEPANLTHPPNRATTTVQLSNSQTFTVTVTDENGCIAEDTVWVEILDPGRVIIPNAFSPNGDGQNDLFAPHLQDPYNWGTLQIYNRWGALLYEDNTGSGWNGTVDGVVQPMGTYVYRFTCRTPYGYDEYFQGNLLLLR